MAILVPTGFFEQINKMLFLPQCAPYKIRVFLARKITPDPVLGPRFRLSIVFHALKWPDFQAPHQSKVDGCQAKKIPKHLRGVPRQQNCNLGLLSKVIFCKKRLVFSSIFLKMHYNQLVPRCSVKNKINTQYKYGLNSGKYAI